MAEKSNQVREIDLSEIEKSKRVTIAQDPGFNRKQAAPAELIGS